MGYVRIVTQLLTVLVLAAQASMARAHEVLDLDADYDEDHDVIQLVETKSTSAQLKCRKANAAQLKLVNRGLASAQEFLKGCRAQNKNSHWCDELVRPNPDSYDRFTCTYGAKQPHILVDPDRSTWSFAYDGVAFVIQLEAMGINVQEIYNWWRPAPYNHNVGGSPTRHPFGTSIDVRMVTLDDMEKAFAQLCKWRAQGLIRAVGYYGSTGLHFGVGDAIPNTWGKVCPPAQ